MALSNGASQLQFKLSEFEHGKLHKGRSILGTIFSASRKPKVEPTFRTQEARPQNADLPPVLPKKNMKPYPIPLKKIKQIAKEDKKLAEMGKEKPLAPPKNGLLAPNLIPVTHQVLDAWKILIKGLAQLLHVIPVYGCKIVLAQPIPSAEASTPGLRVPSMIYLYPWRHYHLYDPFGRRIKHETRFQYDRIPAIVELCIQAGVEILLKPKKW